MRNPFKGVNWIDPFDLVYVVMVILTIPVLLACLVGFVFGGWFVALLWIWALCQVEPEEVERRRLADSAKRTQFI
jgi:hypothetical protein